MLFAPVIKSGASVKAVVPDDKGLGRLEALRFPLRPHTPHIFYLAFFSMLSDVAV